MYRKITDLKFFTLEYDEARRVVRTTWRGYFSSEAYRMANGELVEFAKKHAVEGILSDVKEAGMVKAEDQAWVAEYMLPELVKRGLRFTAFVMPASIFAELSLKNFSQHLEEAGPLQRQYFPTVVEAERWLNQQLQPA